MAPQQQEEAAWTLDLDVRAKELLDELWPYLLRDSTKLKELAQDQAFVTALLANPQFAQRVALLGEAAAVRAVATAMR